MAVKLDMSKAYDRVEWNFVGQMMSRMGFSVKWVQLIMRCVSSVSYSFLLNGKVCGDFLPTRGLRQGDPLSPFLFLICAEGFSNLIEGAQVRGKLEGFRCSKDSPIISHLFFADDCLLFAKANDGNCAAIMRVLDKYARASGQVVNFSKSAVCVSPSLSVTEGERLARLVGVRLVICHERYLGLPCFSGRSKRKLFYEVVDRVWSKVKGWSEKFLSVGGKEILIKAVIQSVPSYAMSLFRLPKGLITELYRLCGRFWWGDNEGGRKMHWCNWKRLCKPRKKGGVRFS
jgi:hypothetical protein